MTKKDQDLDACMIMHQAGEHEMANLAFEKKPAFDKFLTDHLRMWKETGIPAPLNEIQSIYTWMGTLQTEGKEETLKRMAARLVMLNRAAVALNEADPDAVREAGIYNDRPEMRP